jgi:DNA-binding LytR/AlgR family response regulator
MEEKLPGNEFMRIHKSYIVSLNKIEAFTATTIDVPGKELPIGRSYKKSVLDTLHAAGTITS